MSSEELASVLESLTESTKTISDLTVVQDLNQCLEYEERLNKDVNNRLGPAEEHIRELERDLGNMDIAYSQLKDEYHSQLDTNDHVREAREQIIKEYHEQKASNAKLRQKLEEIDAAIEQLEPESLGESNTSTESLQLSLFHGLGMHIVINEEIKDSELVQSTTGNTTRISLQENPLQDTVKSIWKFIS
ncbi:hypothetical protein BDB01DRAFT_783275 [Pilobolus umbonatus]|nr:hypothetical protein BDB01DRAFT_783275 [Pilobolus umbonatus]